MAGKKTREYIEVKVVSSGNGIDTNLVDKLTGMPIQGITAIRWACKVGGLARVVVEFVNIPIEAEGLVDVTELGEKWRRFEAVGPPDKPAGTRPNQTAKVR